MEPSSPTTGLFPDLVVNSGVRLRLSFSHFPSPTPPILLYQGSPTCCHQGLLWHRRDLFVLDQSRVQVVQVGGHGEGHPGPTLFLHDRRRPSSRHWRRRRRYVTRWIEREESTLDRLLNTTCSIPLLLHATMFSHHALAFSNYSPCILQQATQSRLTASCARDPASSAQRSTTSRLQVATRSSSVQSSRSGHLLPTTKTGNSCAG